MPQTLSSDHPMWKHGLRSGLLQDIPPWTRWLMIVAGLAGVVIVVVASLEGGQQHTIQVDKLLHFGGYATLATIFVMGLRPALYVPALVLLGLLGIGIEYLQPLNSRQRETGDVIANLLGLAVGGAFGLTLRTLIGFLRGQWNESKASQRLSRYEPGATIMRQGASVSRFCVIKSGQVQISRQVDGTEHDLGTLGPGDVVGIAGALQGASQYATVKAVTKTALYNTDIDELIESAGGPTHPPAAVLRAMATMLTQATERMLAAEVRAASKAERQVFKAPSR